MTPESATPPDTDSAMSRAQLLHRSLLSPFGGILLLALVTLYFSQFQSGTLLYTFNVFLLASLSALALGLLLGSAGQISVGTAAFLACGGFISVFFDSAGVLFPFDVLLGAVTAGVIGALVALPTLRLRGFYTALATLALNFIVFFLAQEYQSATVGITGFIVAPVFGGSDINAPQRKWAWVLLGFLAAVIVLVSRLNRFRLGRAWAVIREHEVAASALGISTSRHKVLVFALSSAIIGLQGGLTLHLEGALTSDRYSVTDSIFYIAVIVVGGLSSPAGAVVGAAILTWLNFVVPGIVNWVAGPNAAPTTAGAVSTVVYGGLLTLIIVRAPDGVIGLFRALARRLSRQGAGVGESITPG
jgi:branched-chain amino acid transport system permease protein